MKHAHYLLIPIMPFVVLALIRLPWWCAGSGWTEPHVAAVASLVIGLFLGLVAVRAIEVFRGGVE